MKPFWVLLWTLVIVSSASVNGEDGGKNSKSSSSEESNCPETTEDHIKRAVYCIAHNSTANFDINMMSPVEWRFFINQYCHNRLPMTQCLDKTLRDSRNCFSSEEHRFFEVFEDFLHLTVDVVCSHGGQKLARVNHDLSDLMKNNASLQRLSGLVGNCMAASGMDANTLSKIKLNDRLFRAYKSIKSFKQCFVAQGNDLVRTTADVDDLLTDLLEKMKCSDSSGVLTLCSEFDRHCPVTNDYTPVDFIARGFDCFETNFTRQHPFEDVTISEARALVKQYCDTQGSVRHCIHEVTSEADQCFNDTATREAFKVFRKDLEIILDVGCSNNGKKFAKVLREMKKNGEILEEYRDKLRECTQATMERGILGADLSLSRKIFLGYKNLKIIRECTLETLTDKMSSINEFADLTREFLDKMICLHPEDNSVIRCRNLNDEGSGNRTCPELVDNEDKKQLRQKLFASGFECISIKDENWSPDEMVTFIRDYCHGLPRVGDCLADVTHRAEICLGPPPHRIFKVLQQMLESALETGCTQDAERVATVFGDLKMDAADTEAMYECIDMNVLKLKLVPESGADGPMRVYRETESFQECFVNEIEDPGVSNLIDIFLSDVKRELSCQQPFEGSTVLCNHLSIEKPQEEEENLV